MRGEVRRLAGVRAEEGGGSSGAVRVDGGAGAVERRGWRDKIKNPGKIGGMSLFSLILRPQIVSSYNMDGLGVPARDAMSLRGR